MILIVAIPEGLPLSISLAISFSIHRLKKEKILIKSIDSIQNMAMCHEVMVGKTGCLTKSYMNVSKYQIGLQTDTTDHIRDERYIAAFSKRLEV